MSDLTETAYGFAWDGVVVERIASDPRFGYVVRVWARDGKGHIGKYVDVRVSPKGRTISVTHGRYLPKGTQDDELIATYEDQRRRDEGTQDD